ncbi:MAG: HAD-IA family hydrolase [Actinomycetota bacterium]
MNPPAAVIFDFDGTIADTESPVYEAARVAHEAHGLELPISRWIEVVGTADNKPLAERLQHELGREPDADVMARAKAMHQHARENVPVLPGVEDLILATKSAGRGLSIASSSPIDWVEPHLTRLGLVHHFDSFSTRDQVDRGKPAPDLFLLAAAQLRLDPADVIVIEDSRNGFIAAREAGMRCVLVPNPITIHDVPDEAEIVLESLVDFPFAHFGF